jgi:hypothetical protein
MEHFHIIEHLGNRVWLHRTAPVWVREYVGQDIYQPVRYIAYKAIEPIPDGHKPWTVNNVRVSPVCTTPGPAINAAIEAAKEFEG